MWRGMLVLQDGEPKGWWQKLREAPRGSCAGKALAAASARVLRRLWPRVLALALPQNAHVRPPFAVAATGPSAAFRRQAVGRNSRAQA